MVRALGGRVLLTAGALFACEGNHSALVKDPDASGGSGGVVVGGEGGGGGSDAGGFGGSGGVPVEPEGPTKLTIVGGVVDYDTVALCFVPFPIAGSSTPPWPSGGLDFAEARVVDPIDSLVPEGTAIDLWVIGGDLTGVFDQSCEETIANPSSLPDAIVVELGVLPARVFAEQRSLLLVPHGCLGGPTHTDEDVVEALVCGPLYDPAVPSPGLLAGGMSRLIEPGNVGFQVALGVSAMLDPVEVRITRGIDGAQPSVLSPDVTVGAIRPFPPFASFSSSELGVVPNVKLSTVPMGMGNPTSEVTFAEALEQGGLTAADVVSSKNFVAVAVGAAAGLPAGPWWRPFTYVLVPADP